MYEVFINQHPIILTETLGKERRSKYFLLEFVNLGEVIRQLQEREIKKAYLYHPDKNMLARFLREKLPVVTAAGGMVHNDAGEVLFIYRNHKWDLPKGKVEKGEQLEMAALREVEEETGIVGLTIQEFIGETYHIFSRGGKRYLKHTYWFHMHSNHSGPFKPQTKEGIKEVLWKNSSAVELALKNSYKNIIQLFNKDGINLP